MNRLAFPCVLPIIVAFLLALPEPAHAERDACQSGHGQFRKGELEGFTWMIRPYSDEEHSDYGCRASIRSSAGKTVFQVSDWAVDLDPVSGKDVNADGSPDIVFVGYSGGAHCCWTYWIVSLGPNPGLIKKIENQRSAEFKQTGPNGHVEIWTLDGSFDYFDSFEFSHADSVFPTVVLRLEGHDLRDVSSEHWPYFQKQVADARRKFTPEFLTLRQASPVDAIEYKAAVLTIVLAYLYCGRDAAAWQSLKELWPPADSDRIRKVIMADRKAGVLRYVVPTMRRVTTRKTPG